MDYCAVAGAVTGAAVRARARARRTLRRVRRVERRTVVRVGSPISVELPTAAWPTTPVWPAMGAFTESPGGRLFAGCGIWLPELGLVEDRPEEPCAQAASVAAINRAGISLKGDTNVAFQQGLR